MSVKGSVDVLDGIILADPVITQQASWPKPEIERSFSKAVRDVIYSHRDFDHPRAARPSDRPTSHRV